MKAASLASRALYSGDAAGSARRERRETVPTPWRSSATVTPPQEWNYRYSTDTNGFLFARATPGANGGYLGNPAPNHRINLQHR
ncbi:hypothetical protein MMOR_46020 [Mycolicibacterium moriokaense]|uniref:Uncharacterized protein n=1 Tax=Mycolicibacterium moriokaense TaxID=39691 RepID=A0AAD1HG70_9MYCO|nr:hypothetical protein MMOR_46020 [Mycolicibacterium moriokaense]